MAVTVQEIMAIFDKYGVDYGKSGTPGVNEDPDVRMQRIVEEVNSGKRTLDSVDKAVKTISTDAPQAPEQLRILTSRDMQWYYDDSNKKWYASYGMPNSNRRMVFEADPVQMDALFGAGARPESFQRMSMQQILYQGQNVMAGNISEMQTQGGESFEDEVARVTALALDEGKLPQWASGDGAAMDIIFMAQSESKSNDWVIEQLAKLPSFKQRFPGLDKIKSDGNLTTTEAIGGFLEFESGAKQAIAAVGGDRNVVTPDMVGKLINGGHSLTSVQKTVQVFDRMKKFAPALTSFNQILEQQGQPPLSDLQGMFDFMAGEAPSDMYDVYEASSIQEAATKAGLGDLFSAEYAMGTALEGDHTLETATQASRKAAEFLLRLRHEVDVNKFGLDHEELIDVSFGRLPRSGRTEVEIMENINRAVVSAQENLNTRRAEPYRGFGPTGTPKASSLGNLRGQS